MDTRNFTFMFYGFLAAWLILVVYVVALVGRENRIKRELESLKHMFGEREKS